MTKRVGLARQLFSRAAAGLDRAVSLAVFRVALPSDADATSVRGHEARVEMLRAVEARYRSLDLAHFFPEPRQIEPALRERRAFAGKLLRTDLSWPSLNDTFLPELERKFHATVENRIAVARLIARPEPRPVAILVHGYLMGQLAVEERVWPIRALDALGFDSVLFGLPFHGRRADKARSGRPEFPGQDPHFASEGFRQAVTDLREFVRYLRRRGHPKVGLMGMSLGGYTAALTATVEADLDFLVPIVPLASLADFALEQGELPDAPEPRALEYELIERAYRHVSPLDREPLIAPERVLVIGAKADRITPFQHARRLARHFHAELVSWHGGHVWQLGRDEGFRRVGELLKRI